MKKRLGLKICLLIILIAGILGTLYYYRLLQQFDVSKIELHTDTPSGSILYADETYVQYEVTVTLENIAGKTQTETHWPTITADSNLCNISDDGLLKVRPGVTAGTAIDVSVTYTQDGHGIKEDFSYIAFTPLEDTLDENGIVTNPEAIDVLVSKQRAIAPDYEPDDLVVPNVRFHQSNATVKQLRQEAATALEELFGAADQAGYTLYAVSGFRPYSMQANIYQNHISTYGETYANAVSAPPGKSEHQTGWVMDITSASAGYDLVEAFGEMPEGIWVAENAHLYGFIVHYEKGKEDITGYSYEPWHLRYLGKELAQKVYESGLTFDEYMVQ